VHRNIFLPVYGSVTDLEILKGSYQFGQVEDQKKYEALPVEKSWHALLVLLSPTRPLVN